mgnify:CR=1 FL=1
MNAKSLKGDLMKRVLITGVSSGLGEALCELFLSSGAEVYGFSRRQQRKFDHYENFHFNHCDLSEPFLIDDAIKELLTDVHHLDLVILNAGVLGEIKDLDQLSVFEMKEVMEVNVWANKQLLDAIYKFHIVVDQVVAVSSGASVNGSKGWGAYSLSKAALNMLMKVFSSERPQTHFSAIAPGLIETYMLQHIIENVDPLAFPSVKRIKESPRQRPYEAAQRFYECMELVRKQYESGSFVDMRKF